ncbi:MAG: glycerophosphodiester phosphodiesterase family protein [Armatimonadota bacterium]|nr:glycerophosphodiester phosphodiesterase family protein [Armatimonadota bacterium]
MTQPRAQPRVCAHRGGAGLAPENTLAACRQALQLGIRWVEVDVRYTADRVPVLVHDDTVDRTTDGHGAVRQFSFVQLRELDAGSWFSSAYRGERVPSLEQLLGLLAQHPEAGAYVEVKEQGEEGKRLAQEVVDLVDRWGLVERVRLASFWAEPLLGAREVRPEVALVALQDALDPTDPLEFVRLRQAQVWGAHHPAVTSQRLEALHGHGVGVYAWTVNDPGRALWLWQAGLGAHPEDCVATDFPDRILQAFRSPGAAKGRA